MNNRLTMCFTVVSAFLCGEIIFADGPAGNAGRGATIYRTNCLNCHGAHGQGDGPVAEYLTPRPADLTAEVVQNKPEEELLKSIQEGKAGTSMPSWKGELSDQHIQDVLAYLRGFRRVSEAR